MKRENALVFLQVASISRFLEHIQRLLGWKHNDRISRQFAREHFNRHVDAGMRIVGRDSVTFLAQPAI